MYNYTDHLGNIRLRYTSTGLGNVIQKLEENHYYPFGLKHKKYNSYQYVFVALNEIDRYDLGIDPLPERGRDEYQYKYNGKEWQDELSLNLYDYGARNYDAALGRWMNMDPLAEKYFDTSIYSYVCNDPVNYIDPDGMDRYYMNDQGKTILALVEDGDDILYFGGKDNKSIIDTNKDGKQDSKDGIIIKTKGLLEQLKQQKGKTTSLYTSTVEQSETAEDDMLNIFHFAANNTKVEFSLKFYEKEGKNLISLGTYNSEWSSPGFDTYGKVKANKAYHNHPYDDKYTPTYTEENSMGYKGENRGLSGDSLNAVKGKTTYPNYVFSQKSTNLYNVTQYGIELVKKINGNYKNLKK